jgi:hypothetical protein
VPKKTYIIDDWSGGLNKVDHPTALEDNQHPFSANMQADNKGSLVLAGDYIRGSITGLTDHVFTPGYGLNLGQSDYIYKANGSTGSYRSDTNLIPHQPSWFDSGYTGGDYWVKGANGSTETTAVVMTPGIGIVYSNGGANYQKHYVRTGATLRFIKPNNWYQFYILFQNITRTAATGWPGHIDLYLGADPTSTTAYPMTPTKYVHRHAIASSAGGVGGIYLKPGQDGANMAWSGVTTNTSTSYYAIASGICKSGNFDNSSNDGYVWLFGHPNGTTTSSVQDWVVSHIQIRHLPQEKDTYASTGSSNTANDKGEMFLTGGQLVQRYDGSKFYHIDNLDAKKSDSSLAGQTSAEANGKDTAISNQPNLYQGDSLYRISDGNFENFVASATYGPVVRDEKDDFVDDVSVAGTAVDKPRGQYVPQLRRYVVGEHNVNSVWPRHTVFEDKQHSDAIKDNVPLNVIIHANDVDSEEKKLDKMFLASFNGAPSIAIHQGTSSDGDISEDWKKKWHFGISFRLIDNSHTNVHLGYLHTSVQTAEGDVDVPLGTIISDPGYDVNKTDGIHTGIDVICQDPDTGLHTGGALPNSGLTHTIENCIMYVKNHSLVGLRLPDDNTHTNYTNGSSRYPGQGVKWTIATGEFPTSGSVSVVSTGYIFQRNDHNLISQVNMTTWAYSPAITLAFRYSNLDKNILCAGPTLTSTPANPQGDYFNNLYHEEWQKIGRVGGMFNESLDPRINGFTVWAYAEEDVSPDSSVPWKPIVEVDLDDKTFIPYTHDQRKRDLIRADEFNFKVMFGACYHMGDEFTGIGANHINHENPPASIGALTYSEFLGYKPDQNNDIRWKTSTIVNGRTVIGNISRNGRIYPDRIAVSHPGTYDLFPKSGVGDIKLNDGEDIVALASFGSKMLVFKKTLLYLVDVADIDGYVVQGTYKFMGVTNDGMVVTSDYGISWVSPYSGVHHFDGSEIIELTVGKLKFSDLGATLTDGELNPDIISLLAYDNRSKTLHLRIDASSNNHSSLAGGLKSNDGWVYSFKTQDWSFMRTAYGHLTNDNVASSNYINTNDNKIHAYQTNSTVAAFPSDDTSNSNSLFTITPDVKFNPISTRYPYFYTKEIDFGDPSLKKRVYKVIVKYQRAQDDSGSSGGFLMTYQTNGNSDSYNFGVGGALSSNNTDWVIHEAVPASVSESSGIKTFNLVFVGLAHDHTSKDFKIDSLSIIYRTWHAK